MPPHIYLFTAEWCLPCQEITPLLHERCQRLGIDGFLQSVDIDKQPEMVERYGVTSIPLVVCVYNSNELQMVNLRADTWPELNQFATRVLRQPNQFVLPQCTEASVQCQPN